MYITLLPTLIKLKMQLWPSGEIQLVVPTVYFKVTVLYDDTLIIIGHKNVTVPDAALRQWMAHWLWRVEAS